MLNEKNLKGVIDQYRERNIQGQMNISAGLILIDKLPEARQLLLFQSELCALLVQLRDYMVGKQPYTVETLLSNKNTITVDRLQETIDHHKKLFVKFSMQVNLLNHSGKNKKTTQRRDIVHDLIYFYEKLLRYMKGEQAYTIEDLLKQDDIKPEGM